MTKPKNILYDAMVLRVVVITLLVLMHCLTIYNGGWKTPIGISDIEIYEWFRKLISGFQIPAIIFLSGYVYSYQANVKNKAIGLKDTIRSKFKRLLIPSFIFSSIYLFLFTPVSEWLNPSNIVSVLSGRGHMWFYNVNGYE